MAKRPGSLVENLHDSKRVPPPDNFPTILAGAEGEKYSNQLNFEVGCTFSKGHHPARCATGIHQQVLSGDGRFYFQVLLCSKETGTVETVVHLLSMCAIMANEKGEYKFYPGIDL